MVNDTPPGQRNGESGENIAISPNQNPRGSDMSTATNGISGHDSTSNAGENAAQATNAIIVHDASSSLQQTDGNGPPELGKASTQAATGTSNPPLPPRDYSRDRRLLTYNPLPPPLPPNKALFKFFRLLALTVFVTGSTMTLFTFIYQVYTFQETLLLLVH